MMHGDHGWMSDGMAWGGGGVWIWTVVGVLTVVILAVVIHKIAKKAG